MRYLDSLPRQPAPAAASSPRAAPVPDAPPATPRTEAWLGRVDAYFHAVDVGAMDDLLEEEGALPEFRH
jgi:hypothetical protein